MKNVKLMVLITVFCLVVATATFVQASEYDFGGRTVTFGYNHDLRERHFTEPEDIAYLEEIEEKFNVNIEFMAHPSLGPGLGSDYVEYLTSQVMAGETDIDVHRIHSQTMRQAAAEGLLHPLDDFLDAEYWSRVHPQSPAREFYQNPADGMYYAFVLGTGEIKPGPAEGAVIVWNKDLFEREGLPDLYELWKSGDWTWNALHNIALQATKDTTGDGEIDQWGFGAARAWNYGHLTNALVSHTVVSNNGTAIRGEGGQMVFALDEPEAMEALEFLRTLYYEDGVARNSMVHGDTRTAFIEGDLAMMKTHTWRMGRMQEEMEEHYSIVPFPMGPRAEEHRATVETLWTWAIPITAEDPRAKIELTNALWRITEEYVDDPWDVLVEREIENFAMRARDRESLEVYEWLRANTVASLGFNDFFIPEFYDMMQGILEEGDSVSASIDAIRGATQTHLDELFN